MEFQPSHPKPRENSSLWLLKMVTGPLIVVVLGIHLVINHLISTEGLLSYADVIAYYQIAFIPVMEILFLILAVTHSLLGLRSIILDLHPKPEVLRAADRFFIVLGSVSIVYGVWLVIVLVNRG